MTIARNIEQQGENRTGGAVGQWWIYRGKNTRYTNAVWDLDCKGWQDWNGTANDNSLVSLGTSTACNLSNGRNKRALKLSNNQRIRDLAWNVWEHTNKADNINGTWYNSNDFLVSNACNSVNDWQAFASGSVADWKNTCSRTNGYSYNLVWPATPNLNTNNGIGRIYSFNTANNIFLRGGNGRDGSYTGIFALNLLRGASNPGFAVGFRCVK